MPVRAASVLLQWQHIRHEGCSVNTTSVAELKRCQRPCRPRIQGWLGPHTLPLTGISAIAQCVSSWLGSQSPATRSTRPSSLGREVHRLVRLGNSETEVRMHVLDICYGGEEVRDNRHVPRQVGAGLVGVTQAFFDRRWHAVEPISSTTLCTCSVSSGSGLRIQRPKQLGYTAMLFLLVP